MVLQGVMLGLVLLQDPPLALQLQLVAKGGLKRLVLGWLAQVMMFYSSFNLLRGQGNVPFACKFFIQFFIQFFIYRQFSQETSSAEWSCQSTPL
jgi:hypothetical protein